MTIISEVAGPTVAISHVVRGEVVSGAGPEFGSAGHRFSTPALDLDALVWPRAQPGPAFFTPIDEVMDVLVATGERLKSDPSGVLAQAYEAMAATGDMDKGVLKRAYDALPRLFAREWQQFIVDGELGGADILDGWRAITDPGGRRAQYRAFPPRLVHILAGNAPGVAAISIIRGALTKGINLLKLPSNDLYTATAILRTMAEVAPGHPVTESFSAVYWKGGDENVEKHLLRPIFFDKLVAWGGEGSLRSAKKYVGPGFELVAFDPKTSISMIGKEAFASPELLAQAAGSGGDRCVPVRPVRLHFEPVPVRRGEHGRRRSLLRAVAGRDGQGTADRVGMRGWRCQRPFAMKWKGCATWNRFTRSGANATGAASSSCRRTRSISIRKPRP